MELQFPKPQEESAISSQQLELRGPAPPTNYLDLTLDDSVLCLKTRFWWFTVLALQSFLFVLMISCLATPKWIKHGKGMYQWEGGVVTCFSCDLIICPACSGFNDDAYTTLKNNNNCNNSLATQSFCSAFDSLASAGAAYFFFEMLSLIFLIVWLVRVVFLLLERNCCVSVRWLGYVYPGVAGVSHFLGCVIWAGISKARFGGDCSSDIYDGSKPNLCATHGPALAVVTIFFYVISVAVFVFAFYKSGPTGLSKNSNPEAKLEAGAEPKPGPNSPKRLEAGFSPVHGGELEMRLQQGLNQV